ncbi:hypothetical protein DVH05_023379 [Phytophthora capsici]|nr:hypothetical protein DVH05_005891 [Phytophthora capsici]KAG1693614.1 hypothetical protein DVH05_023379 [Phytophthora capsici]
MGPDLVDGLCKLRLNENVANVTDNMLITEIALILLSVKNSTLPDVKASFKSKLRMNLAESDVDAHVLDCFNQFRKFVRKNGLSACFEGNGGNEAKCKQLAASLHPASLKKKSGAVFVVYAQESRLDSKSVV